MLSQWLQYLWIIILPVLAIPLAILLGARWTNGAIIVSSAVAILAVAVRGFQTATNPFDFSSGSYDSLESFVYQVGGVLLLTAWTLALAHAAQARRWRWFALIVVAGFLSYATQLLSELLLPFTMCASNPPLNVDLADCLAPNRALLVLITLGQAIGPIVALIYVWRAPGRRERQLPEGLVVSSLRDETWPGGDAVSAD